MYIAKYVPIIDPIVLRIISSTSKERPIKGTSIWRSSIEQLTPMHISMFMVNLLTNFIYSMNENGINKTIFPIIFLKEINIDLFSTKSNIL